MCHFVNKFNVFFLESPLVSHNISQNVIVHPSLEVGPMDI